MKIRIIPIIFFSVVTMLFCSCKKDYTCNCSYTNVISEPGNYSFEIPDAQRKDAKEACENFSFAGWTDIECKLK